jgi:hypothetical protein
MAAFINQYPLAIPFLAILLAEVVKATIDLFRRRHKIRFINPGGMPSGHSSFVSALVVTVANREGIGSTSFMISAVVAVVVMYDAVLLRGQVGKHAKVLNKLVSSKGGKADLEESLGHTLVEVIGGAVFGSLVAFALLSL